MVGWLLLATALGPGHAAGAALAEWRGCLAETTRVAARTGRVPEEMTRLLDGACPDQRARYAAALGPAGGADAAKAQGDALVGGFVRRYATFYSTGWWPER